MTAAALSSALVDELAAGRLPWHLLAEFPAEPPQDAARADQAVAAAAGVADVGDRVERERRLPAGFFTGLHRHGLLTLQVDRADGGLGLSDYGTFRVLTAAAERCPAAGFALAVHNGIGLPALLPSVRPGALRELILRRLADGAVSGWADTEPGGAANTLPATVAVPGPDGSYRLTGEKVYIGNGTVADELIVSATVPAPPGSARPADACLFLLDTRSPGFRVRAAQEVIGLRGLPLGALDLDEVVVPAGRVLDGPGVHWREDALLDAVSSRGRTYLLSSAALAIGRRCVAIQREFACRRTVDGRHLSRYPAIQALLADSLADLYAIDTVVRWSLIGDNALAGRHRDRVAAKNLTTRASWRIVESTLSLLAAEGVETAASKLARGAAPVPAEQLLRDARVLRVAGGVDFAVDLWAGEALTAHPRPPAEAPQPVGDPRLAGTAARQLAGLGDRTHRLAAGLYALSCRYPDAAERADRQTALIAAGRIAGELLAMTLTLARAADAPADAADRHQRLAAGYCERAGRRLGWYWPDLEADGAAETRIGDHTALADWWTCAPWPELP